MVYYKCKDGRYLSEVNMVNCYMVCTGKKRSDNEWDYFSWMKSVWGKFVVSAHHHNDIVIDNEMLKHNRFMAVNIYRDQHGRSLTEADAAIRKIVDR